MKALSVRALMVGLAMLSPALVLAQMPMLPEQLPITESVVLQDQDELETSADVRYFRFPDHKETTVDAQLEYGLTDQWQIEADVPYTFLKPDGESTVDGIGDVEISTRYGVLDFRRQPFSLDLGLGTTLPTGDRGRELGEGRLSLEPFFVAGQWIGPVNAQLHFAWRRAVTDAGTEPKDEYEYNLALIYPIERWYLIVEGDGESTTAGTKYYVTPGIAWHPANRLFFLLAAPLGVTQAAADYGVIASATLEIENLFHRGRDMD
jgi:Putative MetA-pathway of phenol degradation